jgi:Family of unknown function (DUF5678)
MSIQEQLSQSQQAPSVFPYFLVFEAPVERGVLGNQSFQMPANSGAAQHARRGENPAVAATIAAPESTEMGWLVRNARELSQHRGEWLLIRGTQLLAHSRDFAAVRAEIRDRQIASPFVYYVPTDDESNSVTI